MITGHSDLLPWHERVNEDNTLLVGRFSLAYDEGRTDYRIRLLTKGNRPCRKVPLLKHGIRSKENP